MARSEDVELGLEQTHRDNEQDKEASAAAREDSNKAWGALSGLCLLVFLVVAAIVTLVWWLQTPSSSAHYVHLTAINGSYGLVLEGRVIREIIPGGAADLQGELKKGDEILQINNKLLVRDHQNTPENILYRFKNSDGDAWLLVRNLFITV